MKPEVKLFNESDNAPLASYVAHVPSVPKQIGRQDDHHKRQRNGQIHPYSRLKIQLDHTLF